MMAVFDKINLPYLDEGNRRQLHAAPARLVVTPCQRVWM